MKILLDENISDRIKKLLEKTGFDVLDLKKESLRQLPDKKILEISEKEDRIIITHDQDFLPFMVDPACKAKIILLSIRLQTEERTMAVGNFLISSGILKELTKSGIIYYKGTEMSFSSI